MTAKRLTRTQRHLIERMQTGHRLWWYGDNGPELMGFLCWPQKRTVRALLRAGVLRWKPILNKRHRDSGTCELELAAKAAGGIDENDRTT